MFVIHSTNVFYSFPSTTTKPFFLDLLLSNSLHGKLAEYCFPPQEFLE